MLGFGVGVNEPAIRHEHCGRFAVIVQQPRHTVGERQCRAGGFGRDDEYRSGPVVGHEAGTGARQRPPEVAAETAQPLQTFLLA